MIKRIIGAGLIIGITVALFIYFDVKDYLSLTFLQQKAQWFGVVVQKHYGESLFIYALITVIIGATSLPFIGPVTLLGGFLFGTLPALCITAITVPLGSTISFLCMRYFFASVMTARFAQKRAIFIQKLQQYGSSYLLTLNLLTVVPSFVISALAAITNVPLSMFIWTSAVGTFPMLAVYAYAGRTFADITSLRDIFSPSLIFAFVLLALLSIIPMIVKKRMNTIDTV